MILLLVSSVIAHLEQTKEMAEIPRQARSPDAGEKAATTMRFLRGRAPVANVGNEVVYNEERGFLTDKFTTITLKWGLSLSLKLNDAPDKVLKQFQKHGILLTEKNLFLWLGYVLKYRKKMGTFWADDAYVVKTLSEAIPADKLPGLFKSMEKKAKLRSFAKGLQELV